MVFSPAKRPPSALFFYLLFILAVGNGAFLGILSWANCPHHYRLSKASCHGESPEKPSLCTCGDFLCTPTAGSSPPPLPEGIQALSPKRTFEFPLLLSFRRDLRLPPSLGPPHPSFL